MLALQLACADRTSAQQTTPVAATQAATQAASRSSFSASTPFSVDAKGPSSASGERPLTGRWLDLTTLSVAQRYRKQHGDDGLSYFDSGQQRSVVAGRLKLDPAEHFFVGFRASSGGTFNWSFADYAGRGFTASINDPNQATDVTDPSGDPVVAAAAAADPAGVALVSKLQSAGWEFHLRDLYLSATPARALTVEFGSFGFERGLSSEITTFDEDGYLTGERVRLNDPHHLFFDQISFTSAYLGFLDEPSLFARGSGFTKSNYRQVAARKQLTKRIGVSGEYNWISNNARTHTLRQAVTVKTPELRVIDRVRVETYERLNRVYLQGDEEAGRQGVALVVEKQLGRFSGDFGFASIDRRYGVYSGSSFMQAVGFSLNGDTYNTGIRVLAHTNYKINRVVTASAFYTHITGENITNLNTQGLNAGLSFDLKALANTQRRLF